MLKEAICTCNIRWAIRWRAIHRPNSVAGPERWAPLIFKVYFELLAVEIQAPTREQALLAVVSA